jgi:alginate production protein
LDEETIITAYVVVRNDRTENDDSPRFFGLHSSGEIADNFDYWLELAQVRGQAGPDRLRGFGFDVGLMYVVERDWEPSFAIGYAFGTGDDDPDDGVEERFRQTGFQENEGEFNGVPSFHYYGELLDPELSNISILTLGTGLLPTEESSVDLVYHRYQQQTREADLSTRVRADPDGGSRLLGDEVDLVAGFEDLHRFDLKLVLGYFMPGRAFPADSDNSFLTITEIEYSF